MVGQEQKPTVWRESASLILAKRQDGERFAPTACDYELLMLKRSDRTAVVANQCVFPGGIFDRADEAVEWLKYFEEFGVTQEALQALVVLEDPAQRPRILAPQGNGCYDRFFKKSFIWAREISLRINAIRETFEEVGVLICRNQADLYGSPDYCAVVDTFDRVHWQKRVHDDAREFLHLCRELKVVPDLWSLHEWTAWASPAPIKKGYETVFFLAFLRDSPLLLTDDSEVKDIVWGTPAGLLAKYCRGEIVFWPPQIYELARFLNVESFDKLLAFSKERRKKGITLNLPVFYVCTDGLVSVLPGDDYYVDDPRGAQQEIAMDCTATEFRARAERVHRCEQIGTPNIRFYLNFEPFNGHLPPRNSIQGLSKL